MENVATDVPLCVNFDSASLPRRPIKVTLLTVRDAIFPCNVTYNAKRQRGLRLFGGEAVNRSRLVPLAGLQHHRREAELVGRVRKMLRFEAEAVPALVRLAALATQPAVELIAG